MSALPNLAKYKHFKTIWEHTLDNSPNCFQFLLLEVMAVQARSWNCVQLLRLFVCQFTIPLNALFRMTFHIVGPRDSLCEVFSHPGNLLVAPQKFVIRTSLCILQWSSTYTDKNNPCCRSTNRPSLVRVLKQSQSAFVCCVSHLTILSEFTCVMNVWDQTC